MTDDKNTSENLHWLVRPQTIRRLWFVFAGVLVLTVIAGLFVSLPGHFKWDGEFWFFAAYGFASCAAMVFGAKALGYLFETAGQLL